MNQKEILLEGVKILNPFMNKNDFTFTFLGSGCGSGGNYAFGHYSKKNRVIELHYRYSLGKINYRIEESILYHEEYMKMLGIYGKNHYPGFSKDCFQAFKDLLFDLENYAEDFIKGTGKQFKELAEVYYKNPNMFKGFKGVNILLNKDK